MNFARTKHLQFFIIRCLERHEMYSPNRSYSCLSDEERLITESFEHSKTVFLTISEHFMLDIGEW